MVGKSNKIDIHHLDLIVYDFDGVMTDNRVLVFDDGQEAVWCNRSDGLAVGLLRRCGLKQLILSTETGAVVAARARKLGLEVLHGVDDKKAALTDYCRERRIDLKKVFYIGNDLNDLAVMSAVGYPAAPQDAAARIKRIARIVVKKNGGDGVIRELIEHHLDLPLTTFDRVSKEQSR